MAKDGIWLGLLLLIGACALLPDKDKDRIARSANYTPTMSARECLSKLSNSGARFSRLPDKNLGDGCTQINTVSISALPAGGDTIGLTNIGPLACTTAKDFAGWTRTGLDKAARTHLGSGIARIETMGTYSCRNVAGTARRSGHARSEAVDISGFVLEDGRRISVLADWHGGSPEEQAFLRAAERSACENFGMVLGPDYNAAHANHFHLESSAQVSGWRRFAGYCR